MKTATYEYKCRRCGKIFDGVATGERHAAKFLIELLSALKESIYKTGGILSKTSVHACDENGTGVGDLIGYRVHEGN